MSATDEQHERLGKGYPHTLRLELHKALMARGIDYWVAQGLTFWNCPDGRECVAYGYQSNGKPRLAVKIVGITDPEQAIEATLGREPDDAVMVKLHDQMNAALLEYERVQGIEKRDGDGEIVVPFVAKMHSLLEEAATLGRGTCRLISAPQYGEGCQECSACGEVLDGYLFDGGRCPNCRAKVVDE